MGKKGLTTEVTESTEVIEEEVGVGAKIAPTEGEAQGDVLLANLDADWAREKEAEFEEAIDDHVTWVGQEQKLAAYESYFCAALSGVVGYLGADGDQHGVLVEIAHEIAMMGLSTAPVRRENVLARVASWGLVEEV